MCLCLWVNLKPKVLTDPQQQEDGEALSASVCTGKLIIVGGLMLWVHAVAHACRLHVSYIVGRIILFYLHQGTTPIFSNRGRGVQLQTAVHLVVQHRIVFHVVIEELLQVFVNSIAHALVS